MTRVADSSFLITLFDADDPRQETAREQAERPDPILVPPAVLGETLGVVQARHGYELALGIWDQLGGVPQLSLLERSIPEPTSRVFEDAEGALSWVDAAVVAWCREEEAEPLAFDPDIEAAAAG